MPLPLAAAVDVPNEALLLGVVLMILMQVTRWLWDYRKDQRATAERLEPRHTPAIHHTYATKTETVKIDTDMRDGFSRAAAARKGIHQEIDAVKERLGRVEEQNVSQTRHLQNIEHKLDAMPDRIINLVQKLIKQDKS